MASADSAFDPRAMGATGAATSLGRRIPTPRSVAPDRVAKPPTAPRSLETRRDNAETVCPASPAASMDVDLASRGRWTAIPSWLFSLVVHLSAVLALAFVTTEQGTSAPFALFLESGSEGTEDVEILDLIVSAASVPAAESFSFHSGTGGMDGIAPDMSALVVDATDIGPQGTPSAAIEDLFRTDKANQSVELPKGKGANFYGLHAAGKRFVFIVDSSTSMRGEKFANAKEELLYSLRRLSPDQSFYVMFFDANTQFMRLGLSLNHENDPIQATAENVNRVEQWVRTVENGPWTNPCHAIAYALELSPDAIFLLSDGNFTDHGRTLRYLRTAKDGNGDRPKVIINTVGFYSRDGEETLKSIASSYGGTYRFVPSPRDTRLLKR